MIKFLKNKKGTTLIELVTAILILIIIVSSVTAIVGSILKAYRRANDLAEINKLFDNLSEIIISDLTEAVAIEPPDGDGLITIYKTDNGVVYDTAGDVLRRKEFGEFVDVVDRLYYKRKTVAVNFTNETPSAVGITITILSPEGTEMASREYIVKPLGLMNYLPEITT